MSDNKILDFEERKQAIRERAHNAGIAPLNVPFESGQGLIQATEPALYVLDREGERYGIAVYANRFVRPVRAVRDSRQGVDGEAVETVEFAPFTTPDFIAQLGKGLVFEKITKRTTAQGTYTRKDSVDCPTNVANGMLALADRCQGIMIERNALTPILRGTKLHAKAGHNRDLRAWIQSPQLKFPSTIDKDAAVSALSRVRDWLSDFPFASETNESTAIAMLLTAAMRASLKHAPGFLVVKPEYGSGASTLCSLAHIVLTGNHAAVLGTSRGGDELTKTLDAIQMAALPAIVLDNVQRGASLSSEALAQILTEPYRQARGLGQSQCVTVPNTQLVLVNGNNIAVAADLVRRFIRVQLGAIENPTARNFERPDLLTDAQRQRADILVDLFTIVIAYRQCGANIATKRIAYDDWSESVAAPLVWLGMPDPTLTQSDIESDDSEREFHRALLHCWYRLHGNATLPVKKLFVADTGEGFQLANDLRDVITDYCGRNDPKIIGTTLNGFVDSTIDGMRIRKDGTTDGATRWQLVGKPRGVPEDWLQ